MRPNLPGLVPTTSPSWWGPLRNVPLVLLHPRMLSSCPTSTCSVVEGRLVLGLLWQCGPRRNPHTVLEGVVLPR